MANRFLSNIRINDAYTFPASDGSSGQVITTDGSGNLSFAEAGTSDSASVIYRDNFTGDGSTASFDLQNSITDEDQTQIYIDGVYQEKDSYSVSGSTITFTTAPISGHSIEVISISAINTGPTVIYQDNFTGNGSATDFTLANTIDNEVKTLIFLNGVYQFKNTYSVDGTTLSFDTAPVNGVDIEVISIASALQTDSLQAGSVIVPVKNTHTASIAKGTPVYISGNVGNSARLQIAPADASNSAKMPAAGLLLTTLAVNAEGYAITGGYLRNITTDTIDGTSTASNDTVYVKAGGGLTMTKPTGSNLIQNIAKVARSASGSSGSLLVSSILRTNDIPNIANDHFWLGNSSSVATATSFPTEVGNYLTTNSYATENYVDTEVAGLVASAPTTLDTLNELAAALGDDPNFATTTANSIGTKLPLAGGTLTGGLTGTTAGFSGSITASGNSNSFGNTTIAALSASTGTFSASVTAAGNSNSFGTSTFTGNVTSTGLILATNSAPVLEARSTSGTQNSSLILTNIATLVGTAAEGLKLYYSGSTGNTFLDSYYSTGSINFRTKVSSTPITGLSISADGNATFAGDITIGNNASIKSVGSVRIDIDEDNNSTTRAFLVRNNGGTNTLFRVQEDGNVGINDDIGRGKLAIKTSGSFTTDSNDNDFSGVNIVMKTDNTATNSVGSGMVWLKGGNDSRKVAAITNYIYGDTDQSGLNFYVQQTTSGSSAALTEAMTIDSSGNVGIGKSPTDKTLELYSTGNTALRIQNSTTGSGSNDGLLIETGISNSDVLIWNYESSALRFGTVGTEKMRITSGGEVGIGTTLPSAPLDVWGSGSDGTALLRLTGSAGSQTFNWISSVVYPNLASGKTAIKLFGHSQGANNQAYVGFKYAGSGSTNNTLTFGFYANNFLVNLLANGNFGIGTTTVQNKFVVRDTGSSFNSTLQTSTVSIISKEMTDNAYHSILQLVAVRQSLVAGKDSNGYLGFSTVDDSNNQGQLDAGRIAIVNEAGSSRNSATALSFWTNPGGTQTTAAVEKMRITSGGRILMPGLDGKTQVHPDVSYRTSDGELFYQTSSERYKTNIVNLENCLDKVNSLRTVRFTDVNTNEPGFGLIAEETNEIIPEVVFSKDGQIEGISYSNLVPFLTKAIQELKADNDSLKARIETLENN